MGDQQVADVPSAEEVVAGRQRLRLMMATLETLPPQVARAFKLHKLEGSATPRPPSPWASAAARSKNM
jgi:DNA-directed RNA polymerase specialized sigma24 family protein